MPSKNDDCKVTDAESEAAEEEAGSWTFHQLVVYVVKILSVDTSLDSGLDLSNRSLYSIQHG